MSERLMEHAWKACAPLKGAAGSNPALSAMNGNGSSRISPQSIQLGQSTKAAAMVTKPVMVL